ncbi:MAG: SIMPL domain-containing protein [Ignavibacteria bacterium]|nr:SIMPL domain-containing protein [Ignavibacteria bacterium]
MKNLTTILILSATVLLSVLLLTNAFKNRNRQRDSINVTGLGTVDFKSDLIVWTGSFSKKNFDLKAAYEVLKTDRENIKQYLITKGLKESEIVFSSVNINKEFDNFYDKDGNHSSKFSGYSLYQQVTIESPDVDKIENIAREVTELINLGVEFYSNNPQYYYTKMSELKIEMIASATNDARIRAENIASNAGAKIGDLKNAQIGIFQIIGQNSDEDYAWGGTFNTSSKMKTATITMKLEFGIK